MPLADGPSLHDLVLHSLSPAGQFTVTVTTLKDIQSLDRREVEQGDGVKEDWTHNDDATAS